jgi:inorganic pyrophosphatase
MKTIEDFPPHIMSEIEHFFDVYKMLEPNKSSSTQGHEGADAAWREIKASLKRAKELDAGAKPGTATQPG